jgi:hypothetical protein
LSRKKRGSASGIWETIEYMWSEKAAIGRGTASNLVKILRKGRAFPHGAVAKPHNETGHGFITFL